MKITVTETRTAIPAASGRGQLIAVNTGAKNAYYGWENTVTASGDTQGVPVEPGAPIAMAGRDIDLTQPLYLICATGESTTINFTQGR